MFDLRHFYWYIYQFIKIYKTGDAPRYFVCRRHIYLKSVSDQQTESVALPSTLNFPIQYIHKLCFCNTHAQIKKEMMMVQQHGAIEEWKSSQ